MARRCRPVVAALLALLLAGCAGGPGFSERLVSEALRAEGLTWQAPLRMTARASGAFDGDYNPARRRLAFVSTETGNADIWIQQDPPAGLEPPRVVAAHGARDLAPRLSPDGRRLLFVSARNDPSGDIWLLRLDEGAVGTALHLLSGGGLVPVPYARAELRRLTGSEAVDAQPAWHPGGKQIFLASAPSLNGPYDLYRMDLHSGERMRLTQEGAQMPDCSPDGEFLVFAAPDERGLPKLRLLRLRDGVEGALTAGTGMDVFPCWSEDGRHIYFARYLLDEDDDGRADPHGAPSILSVRLSRQIFSSGDLPPARQLTSWRWADTGPRPMPGGFLFRSDRPDFSGLEGGQWDIWALPRAGEVPEFDRVSDFFRFARRQEANPETGSWQRQLAWQNALWAARESSRGESLRFDLPTPADAAEAALRIGELWAELGHPRIARRELALLAEQFPLSRYYGGLARVRLLELRRREVGQATGGGDGESIAGLLDSAGKLAEEYASRADAPRLAEVAALARLQVGLALRLAGRPDEALMELKEVTDRYPDQAEACAQALIATAEIFEMVHEPETARAAYVRITRQYQQSEPYASEAARRVVDRAAGTGSDLSMEERLNGLRGLIEKYKHEPILAALAQNRVGDLFYEAKDYSAARGAYRSTIERYPTAGRQVGAAYLALAMVHLDRQDYERALATYEALRALGQLPAGGPALYRRARQGYVRAMILKARHALGVGDVELAYSTYAQLAEFDPDLPVAHRGLVDCLARMGRVEEAVLTYRPRVAGDPRNHVAAFALARAYSYYGPEDWMKGGSAARRRAAIDRKALRLLARAILLQHNVPYYHQLRGFLFNRIALITDASEEKIQALNAYLSALSFSDPNQDPENHAAVLFNVAEGYMLAGQAEQAFGYYRRAMEAGFDFSGPRGEAALANISRSALGSGDYEFAIDMLQRALSRLEPPGERQPRLDLLVRRAQLLDQLALAYFLDQQHSKAADTYSATTQLLERLMDADPAGRSVYLRNLLRAQRNQAVNLYHAAEQGELELEELARAYDLLLEAVEKVERAGVVEQDKRAAPGLFTIDVLVAIGERGGALRFDLDAEKRLLYTYLARISIRAGEVERAVEFLQKKLALYPDLPEDTPRTDMLSEEAVVWTQLGQLYAGERRFREAATAFRTALGLEQRAGNLRGQIDDCFSLGRLLIRMAECRPERRDLSDGEFLKLLVENVARHKELVTRARRAGSPHLAGPLARLTANLERLVSLEASWQNRLEGSRSGD